MEPSHGALARALVAGLFVAVAAGTAATAALTGSVAWALAVLSVGLMGAIITLLAVGASAASRGDMMPALRALLDPVTGLPREERLHSDVSAAVAGARSGQPDAQSGPQTPRQPSPAPAQSGLLTLHRFALEGFRGYNDAFGETCGDALLAWLGHKLREAAGAGEALYRTRGAGFALLAPGPPEASAGLLERCTVALKEAGGGFRVSCVVGAATLPAEATDAQTALELAARRAHDDRIGNRERPGLRRAAAPERIAELARSGIPATGVAGSLGRALGVPEEQLDDLTAAVALRDVGNVAVPTSVFARSGELPGLEWRFIELHTLVGERLLATSAGMQGAASFVRSSHERFDGSGYPDGLVGEHIPLGARIVFVCSAFEDMTTERAHRPALSVEDALSELERGAGTQFDPAVVRAFRTQMASALQRAELALPAIAVPAGRSRG
ncbi:MAG: diguanylate cyclase [Actinomycetota bacterium]|nr:diguanylate cyclase [Actinomycetota bacterium]